VHPIEHEQVIPQLVDHLEPIFESSPDGVYIWLDGHHWAFNDRFAEMFGWTRSEMQGSAFSLDRFVDPADQEMFVWNYQNRVASLAFPVTFRFLGRRRDGSTVQAETDMIPLAYGGHTLAYHFVRVVGS
jgi:PAS domain S-box-containing protein